jgi:YHS domain-containing protein/thiol-disulfide isomerase/thioredoxin
MRSGVFVAALIGSLLWANISTAAKKGVLWQTNLEEAKQIAAQTNRLVLVHFWSPSCVPCKQLEKNVFAVTSVQQAIQARYVPVKINADDWPTTTKQYGITVLPTDLIITPSGQIIGRMVSPPTPDAYIQQLAIASSAAPAIAASPNYMPAAAVAMPSNTPAAATVPNYGWMPVAGSAPPGYVTAAGTAATASSVPPTNPGSGVAPNVAWGAANQSAPNATPAVGAYSDSRYAEYFQRFSAASTGQAGSAGPNQSAAAPAMAVPQNYAPVAPAYTPPAYNQQPAYNPPTANIPAYRPPAYSLPANTPPAYPPTTSAASATGSVAIASMPVANAAAPALALDGYCPVTLLEQGRWQLGDRRWGVIHRGRTYLFAGPEMQRKFLENPDRYSPAISGEDVVMALDYGKNIDGARALGLEYQNRIYLFSSDASRQRFMQNPQRYATEVLQAENPSRGVVR